MLAAWHASLEVGHPLPNKEFLVNVFPSLGENRREALKIAAGFRGEEAFRSVGEDQAFDTVLPWLSEERCVHVIEIRFCAVGTSRPPCTIRCTFGNHQMGLPKPARQVEPRTHLPTSNFHATPSLAEVRRAIRKQSTPASPSNTTRRTLANFQINPS